MLMNLEIISESQVETKMTRLNDAGIIVSVVEKFQKDMSDGKTCNFDYMWRVAVDPANDHIVANDRVLMMAYASLTKVPAFGCRASNKAVVRRANAIRPMLKLASDVGWAKIIEAIAAHEKGSE